MASELSTQCDLYYWFLRYALPEDTIEVDLKVYTLMGIHTFKKDYKSQTSTWSSWRTDVQLYPSLKKKVKEFMCQRQAITTPYATRPYHTRPKNTQKKRILITLTRLDRSKLSKPRKINVYKYPLSSCQLNWKSTTDNSLTQEAIDVACSTSTYLAPSKEVSWWTFHLHPYPLHLQLLPKSQKIQIIMQYAQH